MARLDRFSVTASEWMGTWLYDVKIWDEEAAFGAPTLHLLYSDDEGPDVHCGSGLERFLRDFHSGNLAHGKPRRE